MPKRPPVADGPPLLTCRTELRVRYPEVDAMGFLHHSRYLQYFEIGRVELLRDLGHSYADLERAGVFFVVVHAEVRYHRPIRYDEVVTLVTHLTRKTAVRYDHRYELRRTDERADERADELAAEGATTIACVGRDGNVMPIPPELSEPKSPA